MYYNVKSHYDRKVMASVRVLLEGTSLSPYLVICRLRLDPEMSLVDHLSKEFPDSIILPSGND